MLGAARQISKKRVGWHISSMGKKAGVVINKREGKCASAQDLRRSFGTRWASGERSSVLTMAASTQLGTGHLASCERSNSIIS
jgi:hypothetical protein